MSEDLKAAQARIAELDAWKEQEMQVMSPLMDYARGVCTGPLGCSLADWLVQDHKQLRAELSAIKAQGVVMPEPMKRGDEGGSGEYGAAMIRGYNACLREVARLNAAPVQQVSVQGGLELIKRMQVCLSLDDTEWGLSAPEKYKLLGDIKSYVLAAPAAPAADAGLVAVEWAKDAEEWGPALNAAGWLFLSELNEDPQKSALIFNNCKGPLRAAIMKYAEIVTAHSSKGVV